MPNWCSNSAQIIGSKRAINKIKSTIALQDNRNNGKYNLFKTLIGIDIPEEQYKTEWYQYNISNWGTKWDIPSEDIYFTWGDISIGLSFSSAWSPPIEFYKKLSKVYKVVVVATFEEGGCDFAGRVYVKGGEVETDETYNYLEGLYHTNSESFDREVDWLIDVAKEEGKSVDEFLSDFSFVGKDELKQLKERFLELNNA